jgi:hypothetical protein
MASIDVEQQIYKKQEKSKDLLILILVWKYKTNPNSTSTPRLFQDSVEQYFPFK